MAHVDLYADSRADDVLGHVCADTPIERREQYRLRRAPLDEAVADQVIHSPPGHGLVIGVAGKWGIRDVAARVNRESLGERTRIALEAAERYAPGEQSNERFREGWDPASDES